MEMLPIKRGPPPPAYSKRGPRGIYGFAGMLVGEWFEAPRDMGKDTRGRDKRQRSIVASAHQWRKANGMEIRFVTYISGGIVVCRRVA